MTIIKKYNSLYIIILLLLYMSTLVSYFQIHPKVIYVIVFALYALIFLIYKNSIERTNKWIFFAIVALIPSTIVGIYMEWSYIDISADIARYLAPFLGFSVGILLLKRLKYHRIIYLLYGLLALQVISYYYSVASKASHIFQGAPIIEYAKHGLEAQSLYFLIAYFLLKNKLVFGVNKVLLIGYAIGYIVNPILIMSKARLIAVLLLFVLIFIFHSKFKERVLLSAFALLITGATLLYSGDGVFSRFQSTIELVETDNYFADASTSVRVAEIINVTNMLYDKSPYSLFFGFGAGALYYDNYAKIKGGIHQGNFRADGGIHDIFTMPFAYIFRYGFLGFFLMYSFAIYYYRRILYNQVDKRQDAIAASLKLFIIISIIADLFVPVHMYGNFQFGFFIAMGVVLQNKLNDQYNSLKNSVANS